MQRFREVHQVVRGKVSTVGDGICFCGQNGLPLKVGVAMLKHLRRCSDLIEAPYE